MDMKHDGNNLVPGQGRPMNLDQLKKLAAGKPLAAGQTLAESAGKPRRVKRAGKAWAGALALGAALSAAAAVVLLERGGLLQAFLRSDPPGMPDEGLSAAEKEKYWALAAYEPSKFQSLLGVPESDLSRQEENARKLQQLLSERAQPGLH